MIVKRRPFNPSEPNKEGRAQTFKKRPFNNSFLITLKEGHSTLPDHKMKATQPFANYKVGHSTLNFMIT